MVFDGNSKSGPRADPRLGKEENCSEGNNRVARGDYLLRTGGHLNIAKETHERLSIA